MQSRRSTRLGEAIGKRGERLAPARGVEGARLVPDHRLLQTFVALDPVIVEASDVTHPVAVDLGIEARRHAREARALCPLRLGLQPRRRVAALLAQRADRVDRFGVVPRPRLEAIVARGDRADRTHVHEVSGQEGMNALFLERRDLAAVAAIDDVDLRVRIDLAHEADAPRAENAAVPVQHQRRTEIHVGLHALAVENAAREFHPALVGAEAVREILERTFAALVAHGTVERVVDEEELEHARARLDDVGRLRVNHHAFRDGRRTRGLQLRHLVDLDDADAAGTVYPQPRVIAVIGDFDAGLDGRLEDGPALLGLDGLAVNRQRNGVHKQSILYLFAMHDFRCKRP